MRALDSRRPQLTSTFHLFPRSFFCLLFLLFVLHAGQPRSVPRDEENPDQPAGPAKLSTDEKNGDVDDVNSEKTEIDDALEQVQGKLVDYKDLEVGNQEEASEDSKKIDEKIAESIDKARSGYQGDDLSADQVPAEKRGNEEVKKIDAANVVGASIRGSEVLKQEDEEAGVVKKRRRNDVALIGKSEVHEGAGIPVEQIGDPKDEGIRRFDVRVDGEGVASGVIDEQGNERYAEPKKSDVYDPEETRAEENEKLKETIPNYFRKSGKLEDENSKNEEDVSSNESSESEENEKNTSSNESSESDENKESLANRGYRSLVESQVKSKHKSSTIYLNAEEKKVSDGEQQSIVDGQIKKLISIRDDALDAQKTDKIDEAKFLNLKREIGMDEVAFTQGKVQSEHRNKVKDIKLIGAKQLISGDNFLKRWKDRAIFLQDQIRDRNFVSRLKEQTDEILPEIPKFTESQLLNTLEQIVLSKRLEPLNDSYVSKVNELGLTENQLRIIQCAEQLVATRDRQSFVTNIVECIRGLNILNCMRIFVWPIVVDNIPEPINLNLDKYPIEINVFDLFQGNRQKLGRAQDLHRIRLLTPDSVVYNILQDALESYPNDETLVSYIDPKNDTLKKFLTSDQLNILQMAEKFLPQALRQEYSDKMFSCVRRFEYFSCVKYFAWPLIKQYFPALPAFPDYQSWYPIIDLFPQYPIFPFPSFSEEIGELPEVVDADATRTRKPRPEALIIQVLQNTLKEQPRISSSPSFLDQSADTYATLIPEDQLLTINMAEQLIPISYRPEFIQKTVRCMKEYNYLACFKYSAWPTVRHFIPTLPDIFSLMPEFQGPGLSDIGSYVPELSTYSDLNFYWPIGGASIQKEENAPAYFSLKNPGNLLQTSDELEIRILEVLIKVRNSIDKFNDISSFILTGNGLAFTERQINIIRLAECFVPPSTRPVFIAEILSYLQKNDNFIDCVRYVIWPTIARYVPSLPEFPRQEFAKERIDVINIQRSPGIKESGINFGDMVQERVVPSIEKEKKASTSFQDKESRNRVPNTPVISVSGTRFVPIFTENPESVILNILRSVQLQSLKPSPGTTYSATKNQQFLDLLTTQQQYIVNIVDSLLPQSVRTDFTQRLIECLRVNNFLICSRDIIWPQLLEYFPWLPSFPNFGIISGTNSSNPSSTTSNHNLTEPSSSSDAPALSETDVKTRQHGDTTVTITDTRFFPIYNELPETIILNILRAVQLSIPNLPGSPVLARTQEFSPYLTEHQINIIQIAENLLPIPSRSEFIGKIGSCVKDRNFLDCTREITWPTIARSYPWLPSFPNFGTLQNLPQVSGSSSIRFQVFLSEEPSSSNPEAQASKANLNKQAEAMKLAEEKIETILLSIVSKSPEVEQSYLNVSNPVASILTKRQINIVKLVERGIPSADRSSYITRMLNCVTRYNFVACTNSISWPTLKRYTSLLPDFSIIGNLFSQLPSVLQIPDIGQIPGISDLGSITNNIPGIPQIPGISQISADISLPAELAQPSLQLGVLAGSKSKSVQSVSQPGAQENKLKENSTITPSVGNERHVSGHAEQPTGIPMNTLYEKVYLPGTVRQQANTKEAKSSSDIKARKRRSTIDVLDSYYNREEAIDRFTTSTSSPLTFPNITESEYLQLLIRVKENVRLSSADSSKSKEYFVDTLNSTTKSSLTADQYEILKIIDDLDRQPSGKGLASQVVQCITSLSFIRCLGIFIWPLITTNLPSLIGLPSIPTFGILGRSLNTESQVQEFFGMSTSDFEKELLERKESIENILLDWYRKLVEDKFQTDVGFFKIKGYGNNELGISFSGYREGRGAKLKDNKNLPSILTIISDIMEEVLDQRPESEKLKKEKEKKERSIDDSRESDIQFLKDSEEYVDIKRSMNDDEIITMFLDKIKSNDSEVDKEDTKYFSSEDAYNAFGVLFGTKLHDKLVNEAESFDASFESFEKDRNSPIEPIKEVDIVSLESQKDSDQLKVLPMKGQVAYDFEKESSGDQEERQRQKRAKNVFKSFLEKYSDRRLKDTKVDSFEDTEDNKIVVDGYKKDARSGLIVQLPRLRDEVVSKKMTNSMVYAGKAFKTKMTQMMPGFGLVLSFLLQIALAHARAAASMAGVISNMALGSAMFGMIRDSFFGSNSHPKIKYVYDNDKTGPGISWPTRYESDSHYYG